MKKTQLKKQGNDKKNSSHLVDAMLVRVAVFLITFFVINVLGNTSTYADSSSISLVVSDTLAVDVLPNSVDGNFAESEDMTVGVTFSGVGGYTLSIRAANSTNLVGDSAAISSIPESISEATFSTSSSYNNMWGYKPSMLNSVSNTNFLPSPTMEGDIIAKTNTTNSTDSYTISIGVRADAELSSGSYSNTFVIAAVVNATCNPNAGGILEAYCMQDMNDSVANSMVVNKQYQLVDNRDNNVYYVAKMKDGRVWMTQNLDLDLITDTTSPDFTALTSENTDLNAFGSQGYTTANGYACSNASTTTNCKATGEVITWTPVNATTSLGYTNDLNVPYSYDNGDVYYYTDTSGSNTTYNSLSSCEAAHNDGTCAHFHSGNYYNFSAAVAANNTANISSGTMNNSICPKGWRLPNTASYGDVNKTWVAEGVMAGVVTAVEHYGTYTTDGYIKISNAPLYLTRGGRRSSNSSPATVNVNGYYRTSAISDATYAYAYYFTPVYPYPYERYSSTGGVWVSRGYELSVRCLARQSNTGGSTTITFDKNLETATGTMDNQSINAGSSSALTSNTFNDATYTFTGWNTVADGSGTTYSNGATYYAAVGTLAQNVTLYAQWATSHTITVNAGAGLKVSVDNGTSWTATNGTTSIVAGEGQTILIRAKDDVSGTVFDNWTMTGEGAFTTTAWRSSTTKTTSFVVGAGDATLTANGTATYTTIADSNVKGEANTVLEMQDVTSCPDWLATGTIYELNDWRGIDRDTGTPETYYVTKLNDGKCWMLDNLRLGNNSSTVALTPSDSNIASNWTLPKGITTGFSSFTAKQINAAYKNNQASVDYGNGARGSGKVGVYYNYCAASAGEVCTAGDNAVDTEHDICPKGWRMPTGGTVNNLTGMGEYYSLYYAYNSNQANYKSALSLLLSGYFNSSTQGNLGSVGYFWSSTFNGGIFSYSLLAYSTGVNPANLNGRYSGFSVRCVLGD